jgi:hypothetical protein
MAIEEFDKVRSVVQAMRRAQADCFSRNPRETVKFVYRNPEESQRRTVMVQRHPDELGHREG